MIRNAHLPFATILRIQSRHVRHASTTSTSRAPKEEGSISAIFTTLTDEAHVELPARFAKLKQEMWNDGLRQSWKEVLGELEHAVEEVAAKGQDIIPQIAYADLQKGLAGEQAAAVKKAGVVVVKGAVSKEEALGWKQDIKDYAAANVSRVKGFPPDNVQVFELYNTRSQTRARTHPNILNTQRALLSLWHASEPSSEISLRTPISYFDRLRIRQPGDSKFTLGPHVDAGSVERWEDPGYRACYSKILAGGSQWRDHDPFDASPRLNAKQDLYNTSNQCSIFRPWQGWTSMSSTGPGEGTLRVLPMLHLSSAYMILRPFFRLRSGAASQLPVANPDSWEPDLDSPSFPGSAIMKTQELNEKTHPHFQLQKTMTSIPKVEPGDQVYWHCDGVHAVESHHGGQGDSSVLYIPAVPLTLHNALYLRDQRINFLSGLPAPDFPGGEGESKFVGRGSVGDVASSGGRQALGLQPFESDPSTSVKNNLIERANALLLA
ncbi:hypothetical protein HGRIS_001734 [Hohenbuehelia grisea]|uniref:DUF1479-domain-containing protein n=1 Tax=Hohenbuehelia grisea TaxID=104357 RepID=A0ABR3JIP3_9AGAR